MSFFGDADDSSDVSGEGFEEGSSGFGGDGEDSAVDRLGDYSSDDGGWQRFLASVASYTTIPNANSSSDVFSGDDFNAPRDINDSTPRFDTTNTAGAGDVSHPSSSGQHDQGSNQQGRDHGNAAASHHGDGKHDGNQHGNSPANDPHSGGSGSGFDPSSLAGLSSLASNAADGIGSVPSQLFQSFLAPANQLISQAPDFFSKILAAFGTGEPIEYPPQAKSQHLLDAADNTHESTHGLWDSPAHQAYVGKALKQIDAHHRLYELDEQVRQLFRNAGADTDAHRKAVQNSIDKMHSTLEAIENDPSLDEDDKIQLSSKVIGETLSFCKDQMARAMGKSNDNAAKLDALTAQYKEIEKEALESNRKILAEDPELANYAKSKIINPDTKSNIPPLSSGSPAQGLAPQNPGNSNNPSSGQGLNPNLFTNNPNTQTNIPPLHNHPGNGSLAANFNAEQVPSNFRDSLLAAAHKYNIPPEVLAAQIEQESSWNPVVKAGDYASTGSVGLSQATLSSWNNSPFGQQYPVTRDNMGTMSDPRMNPHLAIEFVAWRDRLAAEKYPNVSDMLCTYNGGISDIGIANAQANNYVENISRRIGKYQIDGSGFIPQLPNNQ